MGMKTTWVGLGPCASCLGNKEIGCSILTQPHSKVCQRSMEGFFTKAKTYLNSYYLAVIISESGDVSNQRVNMENTAPIAFPARLD